MSTPLLNSSSVPHTLITGNSGQGSFDSHTPPLSDSTNATDSKIKPIHQHLAHTGAASIMFGMLANSNGDPLTSVLITLYHASSTLLHAPCNCREQMISRACHTTLAGLVNYIGSQYASSSAVAAYGPDAPKFVQSFTNLVSGSLLHGMAHLDKKEPNSSSSVSEKTPLLP